MMRVRYQTNPKIAALGLMLSLGLILGAQEAESRPTTPPDPITEQGPVVDVDPVGSEAVVEVSLELLAC